MLASWSQGRKNLGLHFGILINNSKAFDGHIYQNEALVFCYLMTSLPEL